MKKIDINYFNNISDEEYLKVIKEGIKETYNLSTKTIDKYMVKIYKER